MKNLYMTFMLTVLMSMVGAKAFADDIPVNSTTFPDENFRKWVSAQDYGLDGVLTEAEITGVNIIDVHSDNIASLKGIEYFTALTHLHCEGNQLTTLDLSKNTALTELYCYGNQLTALDVSQNTALTDLWCHKNQLTALDVSQNTALTFLWCPDNQLTTLDLSKNTALTNLYCDGNQLTTLDLSKNTTLTYLVCYDNQLTTLDLSKNTALTYLRCSGNLINETEMGNLVESLPINNGGLFVKFLNNANEQNVITIAQVAAAKAKGWKVYAWDSNVGDEGKWIEYDGDTSGIAINEETFPDENFCNWVLAQDYGQDGVLTEAEIAGVNRIAVVGSNIASLKGIEYFTALTYLDCSWNQLTALDVSQNTALTYLRCSNNQLTALDVSQNTALTYLDCSGNQLTALDVSKNTALTNLNCSSNQINETEMSNLVESLPINNGVLYVKNLNNANEQNVITTAQVAAAKAKGWKVYAWDSDAGDYGEWIEYGGDTSGIDAIEKNQSAETPIYNLNGQRVNTPVNGVYIKNGRKVLVK